MRSHPLAPAARLLIAAGLVAAAVGMAAVGMVAAGVARAQAIEEDDTTKLAEEILGCAGLQTDSERLECYDTVAQPLMGLGKASQEGGQALHSFTGKENWDSQVLEIGKPWRVVWQNQGSALTIELWTPQEEMLDVIGNQIGRGGGRSEVLEPGSYRLAVRGLGGWNIKVVEENGD